MTNNHSIEQFQLKEKKAVITGATKGIGLAIAECFITLGAEVILVARTQEDLADLIAKHSTDAVTGIAADLSTKPGRDELIRAIKQETDQLDILVNNVGTNIRKSTVDYTDNEFDQIFATNLKSTFELSRGLQPLLKKNGTASIVNISSVAGLNHIRTGSPYGMTKAAINQLTKNLAVEWAADGIRVNAVAPWYINTPLAKQVLQNDDYRKEVLS
ncbi:MAG: SDR family NAD(P)-dependent oxidoreductase, partial [Calditrichaeota bacterium]|nr:SDR family NAD(P)-dependent oxidoreductase [Calditrichota bacterium]